MRILILSQFFSATKGGGEYVFNIIAKTLANNNNEVWIITNKIRNEEYTNHERIKIIFVPPIIEYQGGLPVGLLDNLTYTHHAIKKGLSIIRKEKIDIIHSNNFSPALAGSILSTITNKPHVTTIHDVFSLCGKNYWKMWGNQSNVSRLSVFLAPFFEKMIIKLKHSAIHTVSNATKNDLIKFGAKEPIYIIPNTVEINKVISAETVPYQFVYVGRLVFYKNLEVVLRAIHIIKKEIPEITLNIAGDGPHRKNLERIVERLNLKNNVRFNGFVSNEEKSTLLESSQALVFPSLCEGFGLVLLEAFIHKKPVLVSNIPPLSDIVSNGYTGMVISAQDEIQWADAMMEIINNPEKTMQMGQRGRQVLEKIYSIDNMYYNLIKMYEDLI